MDTLDIGELLYTNHDRKGNPRPDIILKAVQTGNYKYIKYLVHNNCDFNLVPVKNRHKSKYSILYRYFMICTCNGDFKMAKLFYNEMKKKKYHITKSLRRVLLTDALNCQGTIDSDVVNCQGLTWAYNKDAIKFIYKRLPYSKISALILEIIRSNNLEIIKFLFEIGYTIKDGEHCPIISLISNSDIMLYLIDKGLNINATVNNCSILCHTIINGNLSRAKLLLNAGAMVNYDSLYNILCLNDYLCRKDLCLIIRNKLKIFKLMLSKIDNLDDVIKSDTDDDLIDSILKRTNRHDLMKFNKGGFNESLIRKFYMAAIEYVTNHK